MASPGAETLAVFEIEKAPLTMFTGIRKLEPGCSLVLEGGRLAISRYWSPPAPEKAESEIAAGGFRPVRAILWVCPNACACPCPRQG
jgi:asparagine synthetase B (glutamine-hydrolysing)